MTFISYSQNFEDVMLWRALKHVGAGFYIDIGAAHPDEYSVTRAFYDRGWHGINVEPVLPYFRRLSGARPRDVNLNIALAAQDGQQSFFEVKGTGLSTLDYEIANKHKESGWTVSVSTIEACTLARLCREHVTDVVHFLKIDVEGTEAAVLAGADLKACRPWVIVVEATKPLSPEQNHVEWEGCLATAGYRFVYFDGLNRFYVAPEHWDDLSPAFAVPPNVFDDFIRAADSEDLNRIIVVQERAARAEEQLTQAEASKAQAEARAARAEEQLTQAEASKAQAEARAARAEEQLTQAEASKARAETRAARAEEQLTQAEASKARAETRLAQAEASAAQAEARRAAAYTEATSAQNLAARAEVRATGAELAATQATATQCAVLSEIAALQTSTSWRVTRPLRSAKHILQGHFGAALIEVGMSPTKVERLRRAMLNTHRKPYLPASAVTDAGPTSVGDILPETQERELSPRLRSTVRRRTRTIHQFHPGSSTGDAITNAMFLMQGWLRGAGYDSSIFVEHLDPRLADRLFELKDLPLHDDYVLIVHHSMGSDSCGQVIALPARKILMYHNITPPEFLGDFPELIPYSELGRRQLLLMRPHMSAALADSEFNALELRAHGYDSPVTCPFLFDTDQLVRAHRSNEPPHDNALFTVLFVGRLVASKGQADLVDAFAEFRRGWGAPCRLVLVGRMAAPDASYPSEVRRRIDLHGLQDEVLITGPVSDAALHKWYRAAHLYVSLSHHEGFGVPLVEAMAHDVPVLAWPAGAVPYTLGTGGELLPDRAAAAVGAAMLRLANDSNLRATLVERQRAVLDRFRLDLHAPKLIGALLTSGAAPPPDEAARQALARNLSIAVTGHINGNYSLAVVNRTLALALEHRRPGTTRIVVWENGPTSDLSGVPIAAARQVEELVARPQPPTGPEIVISQHYPVHVPPYRGDAALAMVFWEESLLPQATVEELNRGFAGVLAPTNCVAKALIDSGVSVPVSTVGFAPQLEAFRRLGEERDPAPAHMGHRFTVLHVSSCFPRKGVDALLAAFQQAFRATDAVRLIIKGFPNPHNDVPEQVERLRGSDPDLPEIVVINEDLGEPAMLDLYRQANAIVLPTRGEGFNIPAAEAMAAGIPLIVTGYGGHLDFCGRDDARFVDFRFVPSESHLATPGSVWVEPDQADLTTALRQAFADFLADGGVSAAKSIRARQAVRERLDELAWADRLHATATAVLTACPRPPLRVAVVSTWGIPCGIAEYSRFLLERFVGSDRMERPVILCDERTSPSSSESMIVRPVWRLKDSESVGHLARSIATSDPHAILIQHQPGLIQWLDLARLLQDRRVCKRVSVVTLHAAARLLELGEEERLEALSGLGQATRVLVHQTADLNLLRELGLTANVTLFPQGAPPRFDAPSARALTSVDTVIVGSYGFFLPGKGLPRLIEAAAQLQREWPRLRVKLVNAEYPAATSDEEIARCHDLANSLGLNNAIEWDTTFHAHDESIRRLATCDLLVLPYDESGESSSAALRSAMASGVPVAVSPIALFRDAGLAVHRFDDVRVASIAAGINLLLRDRDARLRYQQAASVWLEACSWDILARRLQGMLAGEVARAGLPTELVPDSPRR